METIYKTGNEAHEGEAYFHLSDLPPTPKPELQEEPGLEWIEDWQEIRKTIKVPEIPPRTPAAEALERGARLVYVRITEVGIRNNEGLRDAA